MNKNKIIIYQAVVGVSIAIIIAFLCIKPVEKFINNINTNISDSTTIVGPEHNLLATITGYSTYTDSEPNNQIMLVDGQIHNVITFQDVTKYRINFSNNESMNISQSEFNRYAPELLFISIFLFIKMEPFEKTDSLLGIMLYLFHLIPGIIICVLLNK